MIDYSYQQGIPSFPGAHSKRTPKLSVLGLEQFEDGWLTGKLIPGPHEFRTKCAEGLVLVCKASIDPRRNSQEPVYELMDLAGALHIFCKSGDTCMCLDIFLILDFLN